jgi:MoxR-like ATPase
MDYPEKSDEAALAHRMIGTESPEAVLSSGQVKRVIDITELHDLRACLQGVLIRDELVDYIVEIVQETRRHESILVGASPRATQSMVLACRALASMEGRDFVTPDDVKFLAVPVLEHRLILRPDYEIEGLTVHEVIQNILQQIGVPR